jgi:protein SCO1/2
MRAVALEQHPGAQVPLNLTFRDATGQERKLGDVVRGDVPVVLVLAYARCTMLCNLVLRGISGAMAGLSELELGRDYRALVVSIDEREGPKEAKERKAALLQRVGEDGGSSALSYFVRGGEHTRMLANVLGFRYAWDPASQQYAHPSVVFILSPEGRVMRYLEGITFSPEQLESALVSAKRGIPEASVANTGGLGAIMRCFRFDPVARRYGVTLARLFQGLALVLLSGLIVLFVRLQRLERRKAQ